MFNGGEELIWVQRRLLTGMRFLSSVRSQAQSSMTSKACLAKSTIVWKSYQHIYGVWALGAFIVVWRHAQGLYHFIEVASGRALMEIFTFHREDPI